MRNITDIRLNKLGGVKSSAPYNYVGSRFDLPLGIRSIHTGTLLQEIPVPEQLVEATLFRRLTAEINQEIPLLLQVYEVTHNRVLLAAINQEIVVPEQDINFIRLYLRRAVIKQFVPKLIQIIAPYYSASLTHDIPLLLQASIHGNVILADGTMLTALWENVPVLEQEVAGTYIKPSINTTVSLFRGGYVAGLDGTTYGHLAASPDDFFGPLSGSNTMVQVQGSSGALVPTFAEIGLVETGYLHPQPDVDLLLYGGEVTGVEADPIPVLFTP